MSSQLSEMIYINKNYRKFKMLIESVVTIQLKDVVNKKKIYLTNIFIVQDFGNQWDRQTLNRKKYSSHPTTENSNNSKPKMATLLLNKNFNTKMEGNSAF